MDTKGLLLEKQKRKEIQDRFKRSSALISRKLMSYLPVMILTNLSTLLLVSVDGIVVGNYVGAKALSSVNIFYPATVLIGVISTLVAAGVGTCLSVAMGKSDQEAILKIKRASKWVIAAAAVFTSIAQIPACIFIINSYHLSEELFRMTWQYAIGVMITTPFGIVSFTGVYQMQILGRMKAIMALSIQESIVNLLLDLLFVGTFKMGVAGAGYATMTASILRCVLTVLYIALKTDIYHSKGAKPTVKEVKEIIIYGLPEAGNALMLAVQNYLIIKIILMTIGESGGAVKGVCTFAVSAALVLINGIAGSVRPLAGILSGGQDWEGIRLLMLKGFVLNLLLVGAFSVIVECFPALFYSINGVKDIPPDGSFMLRLSALHYLFKGANTLFRLYFSCRKKSRFSVLITVIGNATLPAFAFGLSKALSPPWLWGSYLLTETVILLVNLIYYSRIVLRDRKEAVDDLGLFYLTLTPDNAIEASRKLRAYADESGFDKKYSYRIALCVEEMAAYSAAAEPDKDLHIQIVIRYKENEALFMMLDDGKCIALNKDEETRELITDNYGLLRKLAKSVEYQYILNLNYTVFTF